MKNVNKIKQIKMGKRKDQNDVIKELTEVWVWLKMAH